MFHAIAYLRAWLSQWHPKRRLALRKRRLETVCRNHGVPRALAQVICREFFE